MTAIQTADRADAFVRRQGVWSHLVSIFRDRRPNDDELARISTLAEVAIDQVFSAHRLTEAEQIDRHGAVKDYAECAALYGYALGYDAARREAEAKVGRDAGQ